MIHDVNDGHNPHPYWAQLVQWLSDLGMNVSEGNLPVQARSSPGQWLPDDHPPTITNVDSFLRTGAGYGLFATSTITPSTPLFNIPAKALMNSLTLAPHYPPPPKGFTCTQYVALHLMLHRPKAGEAATDPLFGPYISVLPREFDTHPLAWLWKHEHGAPTNSLQSQLLRTLPPRVMSKLDKMSNLFEVDWNTTKKYLQDHAEILRDRIVDGTLEEDYLWAWLNGTSVFFEDKQASWLITSPDNMTLCPILDFANHTTRAPYTTPKPTNAEIWNTGPLGKGKYGDNFILLSPSETTLPNEELFLRYGAHPNSTLFTEYGFVNISKPYDGAHDSDDYHDPQIELAGAIESLFTKRGAIGAWLQEKLDAEGYWGDWTMHSQPAPAHPSYRLITTLRLYHLLPESATTTPSDMDQLLNLWRDTTLGKRPSISSVNERLWRSTLESICREVSTEAEKGLARIRALEITESLSSGEWIKQCIETLWQEQIDVAVAVLHSLKNDEEF